MVIFILNTIMQSTTLLDLKKYYIYLDFIKECKSKDYANELVLHNHHIIPSFIDEENEYIKYTILLSVDDHIKAHILLSECFDKGSREHIGNLRSAKILNKKSLKYKSEIKEIYQYQKGDNNTSKIPEIKQKISKGLKEYYKNNLHNKKNKTYLEIYGDRAEEEILKRKKRTRTLEQYKVSAKKASAKLKGRITHNAKKIIINGIEYKSISDASRSLKISKYKLKLKYDIN